MISWEGKDDIETLSIDRILHGKCRKEGENYKKWISWEQKKVFTLNKKKTFSIVSEGLSFVEKKKKKKIDKK